MVCDCGAELGTYYAVGYILQMCVFYTICKIYPPAYVPSSAPQSQTIYLRIAPLNLKTHPTETLPTYQDWPAVPTFYNTHPPHLLLTPPRRSHFRSERGHGHLDERLCVARVDREAGGDRVQVLAGELGGHLEAVRHADRVDALVQQDLRLLQQRAGQHCARTAGSVIGRFV